MKTGSVRRRIVILYALSVLLLFGITAAFLFAMEDRLIIGEAKENLTALTDSALNGITVSDGEISADENLIYYMDGTSIVICDVSGEVLLGELPEGYTNSPAFEEGPIRSVRFGRNKFYIYDECLKESEDGGIWVRGIAFANLKEISSTLYSMIRMFIAFIPVVLLAAVLAGWYVTRRAFAPLGEIVNTAASINEGTDLSRRIGLGSPESDDEILRTAGVFDRMLGRIQGSFERERQFTNDASHELRTPVAVIMSRSEYALQHPDEPEKMEESLEKIHQQSQKMSELISRLLFLARADGGRQQIRREKMDIGLSAEESAALLSETARRRGITLHVETPEGIYIAGDETLIGQMFTNLISNGIRYGKTGGWVKVRIRSDRTTVTIRVDDNGQGIREEELPRIWERFYRGGQKSAGEPEGQEKNLPEKGTGEEEPGSRLDESMGLGLPITRWIIQAHGGSVSVVSRYGEGTSFKITLAAWKKTSDTV